MFNVGIVAEVIDSRRIHDEPVLRRRPPRRAGR